MITNLQPKRPGTRSLSNDRQQRKLFDDAIVQQRRTESSEVQARNEADGNREDDAVDKLNTAEQQNEARKNAEDSAMVMHAQ